MIVFGTKTTKRVLATGIFACPTCGADRAYRHLRAKRWAHLFFIPLIPLGNGSEFVRCDDCHTNWRPDVLGAPTAVQVAEDITRAVQLLVMAGIAGDPLERPIRAEAARSFLGSRGWDSREIESVVGWAVTADADMSAPLGEQFCRQLAKVAGEIETHGVEQMVLALGGILSADGSFGPDDAALVTAAGRAAGLSAAHVRGILATIEQTVRRST